jgi:hypothetical protein
VARLRRIIEEDRNCSLDDGGQTRYAALGMVRSSRVQVSIHLKRLLLLQVELAQA